jgi:hypothetical protein
VDTLLIGSFLPGKRPGGAANVPKYARFWRSGDVLSYGEKHHDTLIDEDDSRAHAVGAK